MKPSMTWRQYQRSHQESSYQLKQNQQTLTAKLNDLWHKAIAYLAASSEPHVWQNRDEAGHLQWNAYDPLTGQVVHYAFENDMRIWLEERHYQYQ